jgi:hypothetical protein
MSVWEEKAKIRGEAPPHLSASDKEIILEGYAIVSKMDWLKKKRAKRENMVSQAWRKLL